MASTSSSQEPENLKARIKASYDAIAPMYNAWTVDHSPQRLAYLGRLIPLLRPAEPESGSDAAAAAAAPLRRLRVLELGCGAGQPVTAHLLTALAPVHVTANDISSSQIDLAKAALGEHGETVAADAAVDSTVDWAEGDMMALAFADGSLDAVLGFYSIIHLPLGEQAELLTRIGRWLRPGGFLLANFAEKAAPAIVHDSWLHEKGWMFWSGWGVEGTEGKVREAGLELVVSQVEQDDVDANFHWVLARKTGAN